MPSAKRIRSQYVCQACGSVAAKWMGRCPGCQAWNTLEEEWAETVQEKRAQDAHRALSTQQPAQRLSEVTADTTSRSPTGLVELDRVLGGGLVRGSLVLVGGDPGIGKSTLLLQAMVALTNRGQRVLYMSGEESARQVKLRAARLGQMPSELYLLAETRIEACLGACSSLSPQVVVVDSVQCVGSEALQSAHGSVAQIREVTSRLMRLCKEQDIAAFIVGHVTKDGSIAGPKVMEHMVDTVLYFEGERTGPYRILRAHKNRFGSAQEIGVFEMGARGLEGVGNPSHLFLSQRATGPGAVVVTQVEGSRPLLLEVQALVTPSFAQGNPRRSTTGFDPQRTAMLCAVLQARTPLDLVQCDVFVNVAGGVRINEPSADLGVCLALASAARNVAVDKGTIAIGEVGLTGEVRAASQMDQRLSEAWNLGFTRALVPKSLANKIDHTKGEVIGVASVAEALELLGLWRGRTPHARRKSDAAAQQEEQSDLYL